MFLRAHNKSLEFSAKQLAKLVGWFSSKHIPSYNTQQCRVLVLPAVRLVWPCGTQSMSWLTHNVQVLQFSSTAASSLSNTTHLATPQTLVCACLLCDSMDTNTHCTSDVAIPHKWFTSQYTPLQSSMFAFWRINKVDVTAHVLRHTVPVMQPTH